MMHHSFRALALGLALAITPACTSLPNVDNPIAAARGIDQQAYALIHAYAAVLEEATDVVADPVTPPALRRALGQAERAATPAIETLQIAVVAYLRARADFDAATHTNQPAIERTAAALSIAARRLNEAIAAARAPIAQLEALVRAR